jgi:hypothetical protein
MDDMDMSGLEEIRETPAPKSIAAAILGMGTFKKKFARKLIAGAVAATVLVPLVLAPQQAQALPAFARQTGQNCVACHAGGQFPELTPYGRMFKMTGYTIGERALPLSMMAVVSSSRVKDTSKSDNAPADFAKNGTVTFSSASLFIAGKVTENIGLFSQITYDNYSAQGVAADGAGAGTFKGHSNADNIDLRYADRYIDSNRDLIFGVSANNNPSVSDPWNTAAAWMPYIPVPSTTSSQFVDGIYPGFGSGGNVAGLSVYGYLNKLLYAELGGYKTANRGLSIMSAGINNAGTTKLKGTNPYWRLALTREWGPHNLMVGTSGMITDVYDNFEDTSDPTTVSRWNDRGVDAQYQYLLDPHTVTAQLAYMTSKHRYSASDPMANQPASFVDAAGNLLPNNNASDTTNTLRGKLTYVYQAKYGGSLGYFNRTGSTNSAMQSSGYVVDPTSGAVSFSGTRLGNLSGNPATRGVTYEAFWTPIQYARVGVQYTSYSKFNGAASNYDGLGRDAKDNNTLFFYVWGAY